MRSCRRSRAAAALLALLLLGASPPADVPAADRPAVDCALRHGDKLRCLRSISAPVPSWIDRSLPREGRVGGPKAVLLPPGSGEIWVAELVGPPALRIYSLATGQPVADIELGRLGAVEFALSEDGGRVYVSQLESGLIFEIDRESKAVSRQIGGGGQWPKVLALSADGTRLYASNWKSADISEFDLATGALLRLLPGTGVPRGLYATPDGAQLYVAGFGSGELLRIDLGSGQATVLKRTPGALRHIVADGAGRLFISDLRRSLILRYDIASGALVELARTHARPNTIHLSPDGRLLFVSCRGPNNPVTYLDPGPAWGAIEVFDAETGALLERVVGGNQPTGLDLSADGRTLVQSDFLDNRITVWDVPPSEPPWTPAALPDRGSLRKPRWTVWEPTSASR